MPLQNANCSSALADKQQPQNTLMIECSLAHWYQALSILDQRFMLIVGHLTILLEASRTSQKLGRSAISNTSSSISLKFAIDKLMSCFLLLLLVCNLNILFSIFRYIQVGNAVVVPVSIALGYTFDLACQGLSDDQPLTKLPFKFPNYLAQSSPMLVEGDDSD
ncbi:hypothetical protein JRO89_XS02G0288600 [Xanthoceras sorbifolium]|uniref:Uncharacterized protein n=1 Tax=Xanthoceras sorbifolium TaxID=99658 RepID=A0ABQ8IHC9_9ROSI|nr:hypothetical protein JRO89_XS02G0288600 [Xanthoceras sorbifolium]